MSQPYFNIDSISSGYRPIKEGRQYDGYFPLPDERDRIIIKDGNVHDTVDLMKRVVWKYLGDTKKIAGVLKSSSTMQTCRNIWEFLYHHIQYKLDKQGTEELRRPARSWKERVRGIDCDCFSIFTSSILTNLKIPHSFRITKYEEDQYQHVYVVVPHAGKTILIDPVLSLFNYEKPFTQKKDFSMNLSGIDVAVLSGHEDPLTRALLGNVTETLPKDKEAQMEAMLVYLMRTRSAIALNPETIAHFEDPDAYLQMLDYAISYWNTDKREQALEILIQNEEELNIRRGLSGNSLSGFFQKVGDFVKKVGDGVKEVAQDVAQAVVKYNPLTVTARLGFLAAMKLNLKRMASKIKWAYGTQEQAASRGVPFAEWNKAKTALAKIENLFADKLQGDRNALKDAILKGRAGGLSGTVDLGELGEPVTVAATITAATPVIIAAFKMMQDAGLFSSSEQINPDELQREANNPPSPDLPMPAPPPYEMVYVGPPAPPSGGGTYSPTVDPVSPPPANTESGGVIGFIKKNPLLVGLGAVGVAFGAYQVLKPKRKSHSGLSGVRKPARRKSPAVKNRTTKPKMSKGKKRIQQITLK
ncbi:MAG TPA: hypothetical protein DIW47_06310 [Bacteroidetes bacterium]|nr:hypothetical protein [Bacteroidota bacterium]